MDNIWSKVGGRKMIAFALALGAALLLASNGQLTTDVLWAILGLFGTFSGGNVGEHVAKAVAARGSGEKAKPVTLEVSAADVGAAIATALGGTKATEQTLAEDTAESEDN